MATKDESHLGDMGRVEGLLAALGPVAGKRIIDIGCGEGVIARGLAAAGATVAGYDPFIAPTEETREGGGSYRLSRASAEAIPEPEGSADAVLFVFSLHHVPQPVMSAALAEAKRLLKPGGTLCVAEPLAEGPAHYVMAPFHDETEVRANAIKALGAHAAPAFGNETILFFSEDRSFADFDDYATQAIGNMRYNEYSEADVLSAEVRNRFAAMTAKYGSRFEQRIRVNLFA